MSLLMNIKGLSSPAFKTNHHQQTHNSNNQTSSHTTSLTQTFIMQTTTLLLASLAAIGAIANTLPARMGVEVVQEDGNTIVREVVSSRHIIT